MLRVFCRTTLLITKSIINSKCSSSSPALFLLRTITSTESSTLVSINKQNLTVSYLINSCGFPIEAATSVAQKIRIETTERPNSVIELLRTYGLTNTQIANLITKQPQLLLADPVKTLKPKIDFFQSLGFSSSDLAKFFSRQTGILLRSLQKQIIPIINILKTFIHTNENLIIALKQCSRVVGCNIKKVLEPNIATLRSYGVPNSNISKMIILEPMPLGLSVSRLKDVAAMVNSMGFDPNSRSFILAICSISMMTKENWEKKRDAFKSIGWSDDEFRLAFKVQPKMVNTSEKKIRQLMEFFVNDLHLKPSDVAKYPNLFLLSLERRIIPRCSMLQVLMSKGLIKKDVNIVSALIVSKPDFEKRFVNRYEGQAPELIKAYKGEIRFQGFDS